MPLPLFLPDKNTFHMPKPEKKTVIEQATPEQEQELLKVVENKPDIVELRGKKVKVYYMRPITKLKITDIIVADENDSQVNCKVAAAVVLNTGFKIWLWWWFLWRWFYYVKEYTDAELLPLIQTAKKKVQLEEYFATTILLTEMKETAKMMTRAEVERIRAESFMEQRGQSRKSTSTSQNPSSSSSDS